MMLLLAIPLLAPLPAAVAAPACQEPAVPVVRFLDDGALLVFDPSFPAGVQASIEALDGATPSWIVAPHQPEAEWRAALAASGATLLSHENLDRGRAGAAPALPWLRFEERLVLGHGAERVELLGFAARTPADVVLWNPADGELCTGLLVTDGEPRVGADSDLAAWRAALDELLALDPRTVWPGTGEVGGPELLLQQRERLDALERGPARLREALGDARGSVVAIPMDARTPRDLVYVTGRRTFVDAAELAAVAPNVRVVFVRNEAEAIAAAPNAHGVDARFASAAFLRAAPELRWVQASSAGVERYLAVSELRERDEVVFTNMQGMHGPAIADHAFAMLLTLTRELRFHEAAFADGRWERGSGLSPESLHGKTMLVVGLGGIGSEIARRARGFGMTVLATARSEKPRPHYVDELARADGLARFLPRADVVALAVPLTSETEGMLGAEEFAAMKPGSYLVNIARGKVVDTNALLAALESGHLGGACLDVSDPEPLPEGHPLWKAPNLVLTPHVSGRAQATEARRHALFLENVRRFAAGEPLLNVVDKQAGY